MILKLAPEFGVVILIGNEEGIVTATKGTEGIESDVCKM